MTQTTHIPEMPTTTDNRRSSNRCDCYLEIAIADKQRAFLAATVLDLSAGGVKLLIDPAPAPGDQLQLTFLSKTDRLFQVRATVVHYIEHEATWAVGCRFARLLDDDELASLL